jgi:hypothetical protein
VVGRGEVQFLSLVIDLIQKGGLFRPLTLESCLLDRFLVVGSVCVRRGLLAGPGEQLRRMAISR